MSEQNSKRLQRSYDDIPYFESNAFSPSDLQSLAVCAASHGLTAPDTETSRVLELACGCGGNLVSLANLYPRSKFMGIDLSEKQIAEARDLANHAGTDNVHFTSRDILDIGEDIGTFDYIIAHGVFSWVPDDVQDKILEICSSSLNPDGLAMISYMVYPGGSIADTLRDVMHIHLEGVDTPYERLGKGRELLMLLAESGDTRPHPMSKVYSDVNRATNSDARVFYHEYLNVKTDTLYFRDFALRAAKQGLSYVDDALRSPDHRLDKGIKERLHSITSNRILREQYLDYFVNRSSRHSILCKSEQQLSKEISKDAAKDFYLCSCLQPEKPNVQLNSDSPDMFMLAPGQGTVVSAPIAKQALAILFQEWPGGLFYYELLSRLSGQSRGNIADNQEELLTTFLLEGYSDGLLDFRLSPPACVNRVSEKPRVSKLVRFQAANNNYVTNQRHVNIPIGKLGKLLLPLLDGRNELEYLSQRLEQFTSDGTLVLPGSSHQPEAQLRQALENYKRASLLTA